MVPVWPVVAGSLAVGSAALLMAGVSGAWMRAVHLPSSFPGNQVILPADCNVRK